MKKKKIKIWKIRNPEKIAAHRIVFRELIAGRIKKQKCFCRSRKPTEAHHEDYTKPLDIIWLCKHHHGERDSIRRSAYLSAKLPLKKWLKLYRQIYCVTDSS